MARTFADGIAQSSGRSAPVRMTSMKPLRGATEKFKRATPTATSRLSGSQQAKYEMEKNRGGTFTAGPPDRLARTVVLSSNSNAPVVWTTDDLPHDPLFRAMPTSTEGSSPVGCRRAPRPASGWCAVVESSRRRWIDTVYNGNADLRVGFRDDATGVYSRRSPSFGGGWRRPTRSLLPTTSAARSRSTPRRPRVSRHCRQAPMQRMAIPSI